MSVRKSRKKLPPVKTIFDQVLEEDYWEGYYASDGRTAVLFEDIDGGSVSVRVHSLNDGKVLFDGSVVTSPGMKVRNLADFVESGCGHKVLFRISDSVGNPDRHEEICSILESGDRFEIMRIDALVQHIRRKGISLLGGLMGGRDLYDGGYEGFYLLGDGRILFCRDCCDWDHSRMDYIVDGVVSYFVLDPECFSLDKTREEYFGYLRGETFSDLSEHIMADHGRVVSEIGIAGSEAYRMMQRALDGDAEAVSVMGHRLKIILGN